MVTCVLCAGYGKRYETVVEYTFERQCKNCEGLGKVPAVANWRPFESSRETIKDASEYNRCNRHLDCEAADQREAERAPDGRAYHCWSDDCEDCFGC